MTQGRSGIWGADQEKVRRSEKVSASHAPEGAAKEKVSGIIIYFIHPHFRAMSDTHDIYFLL